MSVLRESRERRLVDFNRIAREKIPDWAGGSEITVYGVIPSGMPYAMQIGTIVYVETSARCPVVAPLYMRGKSVEGYKKKQTDGRRVVVVDEGLDDVKIPLLVTREFVARNRAWKSNPEDYLFITANPFRTYSMEELYREAILSAAGSENPPVSIHDLDPENERRIAQLMEGVELPDDGSCFFVVDDGRDPKNPLPLALHLHHLEHPVRYGVFRSPDEIEERGREFNGAVPIFIDNGEDPTGVYSALDREHMPIRVRPKPPARRPKDRDF